MEKREEQTSVKHFFSDPTARKKILDNLVGDFFGGTSAMLVALPSAIAFGLIIFSPLGPEFSGMAAIGGIMGTIILGILNPIFGGTNKLVSAPCAPAAAVLSVFVAELVSKGTVPIELIPIYITCVVLFSGVLQVIMGKVGGGQFIKYIPYPVVAGYLSGVGVLIFISQLPKLLGLPKGVNWWDAMFMVESWKWETIAIGVVTIIVMFNSHRVIKAIPAAIIALTAGIIVYFGISIQNPSFLALDNNSFVVGPISASLSDLSITVVDRWSFVSELTLESFGILLLPFLTLAVLLSIDTLKTCVVLDALTFTRHNSNKELVGQGVGNIATALACGIPGAGTMGATLVNLNSGAKTRFSGVVCGIMALLVYLLFGNLVAWIPISALAGILIVIAYRMVDKKSFALLKQRSTIFDFLVILGVVVSAVTLSLIAAAGVGIGLAILLFLREQIRTSVIRRKVLGDQIFSKKLRLSAEQAILEEKGKETIVVELQGQLFFGTTDQLFTRLEVFLLTCKYVIMDMRRVQSVDFTAVNMLKQILKRVQDKDGSLIITSIPASLPSGRNAKEYLGHLGLTELDNLKFFDDINEGLTWVEDEILKEENLEGLDENKILELHELELFSNFSKEALETIRPCLVEKSFATNDRIFKAKEKSSEIYFVRKGTIKIALKLADKKRHHLVTVGRGGIFGDMAFIDKKKRSAEAISESDTQLYVLSRSKFDEFTEKHPEVAEIFFEGLATLISKRLRLSNKEVKALQDD